MLSAIEISSITLLQNFQVIASYENNRLNDLDILFTKFTYNTYFTSPTHRQ